MLYKSYSLYGSVKESKKYIKPILNLNALCTSTHNKNAQILIRNRESRGALLEGSKLCCPGSLPRKPKNPGRSFKNKLKLPQQITQNQSVLAKQSIRLKNYVH